MDSLFSLNVLNKKYSYSTPNQQLFCS